MTQEIAISTNPMEEFKKRVLDKLKGDIGSLMPEEALAELVQNAVKDAFFTRKEIPKPGRDYYSKETIASPSWFEDELTRQVEPLLKARITEVVEANKATIATAIDAEFAGNRLFIILAAVLGENVRAGVSQSFQDCIQQLRNAGVIRF